MIFKPFILVDSVQSIPRSNQKFNQNIFACLFWCVSSETLQQQIKVVDRIFYITRNHVITEWVNQSVTVALAGQAGRSITEEALQNLLVAVKVRHKSCLKEQSV